MIINNMVRRFPWIFDHGNSIMTILIIRALNLMVTQRNDYLLDSTFDIPLVRVPVPSTYRNVVENLYE
jgi:hypothetical protein